MSKTLVIAEKPSVAQDIVRALTPEAGKFEKHAEYFESANYVVTSAVGHLVEIEAPEEYEVKRGKWSFAHLPVIPPFFQLKPVDKTKSRLSAVVKLAKRKDIGSLINACDAGREGELIFNLIEQFAGGGKSLNKTVRRLWLQSMTPQAIRDGFAHLRSAQDMRGLGDAARSRSEADWLVGINGTRAFTAFNSREGGFFLTTVGRVQTPTLAIMVEREEQINRFISRDYFEVWAEFQARSGLYPAKWFDPNWKKSDDTELKADRIFDEKQALAIAEAVRGRPGTVHETSKPSTQASPGLLDLTSLQREANARFGYSAKTTLALAQSLYERHKALTYPRTDSRHLPEDYLPTVHQTFKMLAQSHMRHLAPHAQTAIDQSYPRKIPRVFDNSKVSDHFAIIPTLEAPQSLSEAEQKIYDLVTRRFIAVFFPSAQYLVTTRTTQVAVATGVHHFKSEGKVLVNAGWLEVYGKDDDDQNSGGKTLVAIDDGEIVQHHSGQARGLKTRPPARYSEATLLGAMEGAGKLIDDEALREAMHDKGLGTPATRAAIIEGLLREKYILREGRELIPTAKAFQLITLLRGLQVDELSRPDLTGEWEYKLSQIEHGKLTRSAFMTEIAEMTARMVQKAKEYDRDSIPGDFATLASACPNCGGVVKENYRRYVCVGKGAAEGCGFSFGKTPAGRTFELTEVEQFLRSKRIGPLDGFRSKAGRPFNAELALVYSEEIKNWKVEFDFGQGSSDTSDVPVDLSAMAALGNCPKCGAVVREHGNKYVCEKSVPRVEQPQPTCNFSSGKMILQQPISVEQITKLLATGKTDTLDKFVSLRTRRGFKAMLAYDPEQGKVVFEFEPRPGKTPTRRSGTTAATGTSTDKPPRKTTAPPRKTTVRPATAKAVKPAKPAKAAKPKASPRQPRSGQLTASPELQAVIGPGLVSRPEVIKKLWDHIKTQGLQDPKDKRTIKTDAKLRAVFGQDSVSMFHIAKLIGSHLS